MQVYWLNPPLSTKIIYPDLGWMNMNTACKDYDWIEPIINWSDYKSVKSIVDEIILKNPKVICVSCYIWNHVLIKDVCIEIKKINPNIIIIRGGPQLEKSLDFSWYDYVCDAVGHGEEFLVESLNQIKLHGKIIDNHAVPWLITKDFHFTSNKKKYAYPTESILENNVSYIVKCINTAKQKNIKNGIQYETTRGCPYACTYCEWGAGGTSSKISEKPLEIIFRDIELLSILGVEEFEIIDANFGILSRDIDVVNHIGKMKEQYNFPESVMLYGLAKVKVEKREKILDALFKNKLMKHYFMSVQSSSQHALDNVKRKDITIQENLELAKKFREKYNIIVKVELILGLPGSTIDDFYYEMDLIQETMGWDWPRAPLTILPQTEMGDKLYQSMYKIQTTRVGITENEEQNKTHLSTDSILGRYKSYQDVVISTYSYNIEEWKEMFFMNKAQKIIGPMIPEKMKSSKIMKSLFKEIKGKSWYKLFEEDMEDIINGQKQKEDLMIIDGKTVEDHLENYIEEIRTMVNQHSYS